MRNFGERLKTLRLNKGYTQDDLSRLIDKSVVSIRYWEAGTKSPSMDAIISLSKVLNTSSDFLLGLEDGSNGFFPVYSAEEQNLCMIYRDLDSYGKKAVMAVCNIERDRVDGQRIFKKSTLHRTSSERYIPKYFTPSAAGVSVPLDGDDFEMILVDDNVPADADYAVKIQGDSMNPYIRDGDIVYVKKEQTLNVGDIGIFSVDGAMYCKQYYINKNGDLELISANPDLKHTNVIVRQDCNSSVKVHGVVLLPYKAKLPDYIKI